MFSINWLKTKRKKAPGGKIKEILTKSDNNYIAVATLFKSLSPYGAFLQLCAAIPLGKICLG
jgi:hypothetical protein